MNIQTRREAMATVIEAFLRAGDFAGWQTTTETNPDLHTGMIKVGHAQSIVQDSLRTHRARIPVTVYVNEAETTANVTQLYALVSPGSTSLQSRLKDSSTELKIGVVEVGPVVPSTEGATEFLTVTLTCETTVTSE